MRLATNRLMLADADAEKLRAIRWVNAWASAIGELRFSAFVQERHRHKSTR